MVARHKQQFGKHKALDDLAGELWLALGAIVGDDGDVLEQIPAKLFQTKPRWGPVQKVVQRDGRTTYFFILGDHVICSQVLGCALLSLTFSTPPYNYIGPRICG